MYLNQLHVQCIIQCSTSFNYFILLTLCFIKLFLVSTLCLIYSCIFVSSHSFSFGFSHLPYAQSCFVGRWICLLKLIKYLYVSVEQAKEKACIRQQSAPHFNLGRRMTTRMQFGAFSNIFPGLRPGHYFLCWWCLVVYLISSLTKLAIIKHKINLLTFIVK